MSLGLRGAPRQASIRDRAAGVLESVSPIGWASLLAGLIAFAGYWRTAAPDVSFGDWGEMAVAPYRLDVPHPTGYPLYVLLAKVWSFLPIGTVAFRANLFSGFAAAVAVALAVLIAGRLGVRPVVALGAALALAWSGGLWNVATVSEVNALHVAFTAAIIWLALRWRDERRSTDFLLGGLVIGLSTSNHLLTVTVAAVVVPWVLWVGRRDLSRRLILIPAAAALAILGLTPYLFLPLRAALGPPEVYGFLTNWDGLSSLVTGADYRPQMQFTSGESLAKTWEYVPDFVAYLEAQSNRLFVLLAVAGFVLLARADRAAATLTGLLLALNLYVFQAYRGDLPHYLILSWLLLAVWLGVAGEWVAARLPRRLAGAEAAILLVPILILSANATRYDRSQFHYGDDFIASVFATLPQDAVLYTYWDAATPLEYAQCVEGQRPDLVILAPNDFHSFRPCRPMSDAEVRNSGRPVFALVVQEFELDRYRSTYRLTEVDQLTLPYGERLPEYPRPLYRLEPIAGG